MAVFIHDKQMSGRLDVGQSGMNKEQQMSTKFSWLPFSLWTTS